MTNETKDRSLCYVSSCTYCCGLNTNQNTKEELTDILTRRTELYKQVKSLKDINNYKKKVAEKETWQFPDQKGIDIDLGDLIRCRLIGFLDDTKTKVGCMAYPKDKDEGIREIYTDMHEASEMCGAFGVDLNVCSKFHCQAAQMYKQLPDNLKDIVDIFIGESDWYNISKNHKAKNTITPLQKLTTIAYFDYVLDRIEVNPSKDKGYVKNIFDNICIIATEIDNLKETWKYKSTPKRVKKSMENSTEDNNDSKEQYDINKFRKGPVFERNFSEKNKKLTTKQDRLEKIFYHLESFFISKKEMLEATRIIDLVIDNKISELNYILNKQVR